MIGERLAELRTNHNMTQEEFAERMDVSRQAVSKWELDKTLPDVSKLLKMSELYQVSIDYLLKGTGRGTGKKHHKTGLLVCLALTGILFIGAAVLMTGLLACQV